MPSALSSKLGLKQQSRAYLVDVPREVAIELSASGARFSKSLTGSSAIKFTHPRTGKKYRNRYGKLPSEST